MTVIDAGSTSNSSATTCETTVSGLLPQSDCECSVTTMLPVGSICRLALSGLASFDLRKSQVAELRFFGGLSLDEIDSVELRGTKAFFRAGGRELRFSFVRRHKALRKALETGAPHISFEQRWDPNCAG